MSRLIFMMFFWVIAYALSAEIHEEPTGLEELKTIPIQSNLSMCSGNTFNDISEPVSFISHLFSTKNYPARWSCGYWSEFEGWFMIVSDLSIFMAYLSIPLLLLFILYKKKQDIPFKKFFVLFAAFILFCGFTHLIEAIIFWEPVYRFSSLLKFMTGVISWVTVIALSQAIPVALTFKSPAELEKEVRQRKLAEQQLNLFIKYTPAAVAMFDKDMKYIHASDAWYRDYNLQDQEIIGKSHYDIFPEIKEMPHWLEDHQKAQSGETLSKDEDSFVTESGQVVYLKWQLRPWYELDGEIGGIMMFTEVITDQVMTRKKLEEREAFFKNIFNKSPLGIALVNYVGRPFVVNAKMCELVGYPENELKKMSFAEFTHPEDVDIDLDLFENLKRHEISEYNIDKRYIGKDGHVTHVNLNVTLLKDSLTNVEYALALVQNISDRVKAQSDLKENNKTLNIALKGAKASVFNYEYDSQKLFWQEYDRPIALSEFEKDIHKDDGQMLSYLKNPSSENLDFTFRLNKDGKTRYWNTRAFVDKIDNKPIQLIGVNFDVTDQKLEEELAQKKQEEIVRIKETLERTFEISRIGSWTVNLEKKTCLWSDMVYKIHEVKIGTPIALEKAIHFYHPEDIPVITEAVEKAISENVSWDLDLRIITARGKTTWVRAIGEPVIESNQAVGLRGLFQDINDKKLLELAKEDSRHMLEKLVEERTLQLKEVNKELESFTYSVSHDLRAPLRAITGFAQALIEDFDKSIPEGADRYLHRITENANKMGQLIDDLLDLSRLNQKSANFIEFNTGELIRSVIEEDPILKNSPIELGNLSALTGDPNLLRQVFHNLISNAVKYSSKNTEQEVVVYGEENNEKISITVKDNGVGFDMKYAAKLFEVFQRLHTDEEFEGTGVGLAICKKITDLHHGQITFNSTPGKGSAFTLTIPKSIKQA